jgi:hypothetical protein
MRKIATVIGMALAMWWAGPALAQPQGDGARLAALSGVYESTAPEPWYGGFGTRRFEFQDGRWALVFEHALDPEMTRKTFRFRTYGPYRIEGPAPGAPNAFAAVFGYAAKLVTLLTDDPATIAAYGFAACGLVRGVELDVSARGCASWRPVADCAEDHDLLAFAGDGLRFGQRPRGNDLCTADKRPTSLFEPIVVRR